MSPACVAICAAAAVVTVTVVVCVIPIPLTVAETIFTCATVELNAPVATPLASVPVGGCVRVFPSPVAASTTVAPLTGFPEASFAVTVIVAALVPVDAVIDGGAASTVDWAAETGPAVTVTVAV